MYETSKGKLLDDKGTVVLDDGRQFDSITVAAVTVGAKMGKSGWRCFSAYVPDSTVPPILVETLRRKKDGSMDTSKYFRIDPERAKEKDSQRGSLALDALFVCRAHG